MKKRMLSLTDEEVKHLVSGLREEDKMYEDFIKKHNLEKNYHSYVKFLIAERKGDL